MNYFFSPIIAISILASACANSGDINMGGAHALKAQAEEITRVFVKKRKTQKLIFTLTNEEINRLRALISRSNVSSGLYALPPPWDVVFVLDTSKGKKFIVHPVDAVLRINETNPWSSSVADATGTIYSSTTKDLWIDSDDWMWLSDFLGEKLGTPDRKETTSIKNRTEH